MANSKKEIEAKLIKSLQLYKYKLSGKVKFAEVDSYGVVHNLQYFFWLEWARTEYLSNLSKSIKPNDLIWKYPIMMVHAEADYFNSIGFGDEYEIYTRVKFIKDSSIGFENIILTKGQKILMKASAILVHLNPEERKPASVPDFLRELILDFEQDTVQLPEK